MSKIWFVFLLLTFSLEPKAIIQGETPTYEIFHHLFKENLPQNLKKDIHYFLYAPTENFFDFPRSTMAKDFFPKLQEHFSSITAEKLFDSGNNLSISQVGDLPSIELAKQNLQKNPITIVIIPGVFGELIQDIPFQDFFQKKYQDQSSFYKNYIHQYKSNPIKIPSISLEEVTLQEGDMAFKNLPLTDLLQISGVKISPHDKQDSINLIAFNLPLFSTESLVDQFSMAPIYFSRLQHLFQLMGNVPQNIYLLGYSRGAPIALEMARISKKSSYPWAHQIKGVISHGGDIYGTELADLAFCEKLNLKGEESLSCQQVRAIERLEKELQYSTTFDVSFPITFYQNKKAFFTFVKNIILMQIPSLPSILTGSRLSPSVLFQISPLFLGKLIYTVAFKALKFQYLITDYYLNIKKLKILLQRILLSNHQLSTQERLKWWQYAELPTDMNYFSFSAVIADGKKSEKEHDLVNNLLTYEPRSIDNNVLLDSFDNFKNESGVHLNDGQMPLAKSIFWPQFNELINPYYISHPIKTHILGIAGAHHWGISLTKAIQQRNSVHNPFPREILLMTMAQTIALEQSQMLKKIW